MLYRLKNIWFYYYALYHVYLERRMAKAENTRITTRVNETWCFRKRSYRTLERTRPNVTSITGEV